jgi:DNA-binding protein H-NS
MRKPRDPSTPLRSAYDAELKSLDDKARLLRQRKVTQLGELVIACQGDVLTAEQLAGALLAAMDGGTTTKEGWRRRGATFFQRNGRRDAQRADRDGGGAATHDSGTASL